MRKNIIYILVFITIISINQKIYADDLNEEIDEEIDDISWIYEEIKEASANATSEPIINSRAGVIYDRTSGEIIWGKDENSKRKMASTTKIMTATVVLENVNNLSDTVIISSKSAGVGGSRLGLSKGDKITVRDLLYGLMLKSGNDCAIALAEYVCESVDNFVDKMNEKAKNLGLKQTHFVTVNGLDEEEHYTTAVELAKMTNYALNNDEFRKIVGTTSYMVTINGYGKTIGNTNELLGNLNGVYGVKTGFTNGANRCLVTSIKRNDMDIICVVLGADTKKDRTKDSIKIIEYAFSNYKIVNIENKIEEAFEEWKNKNNIQIIKGVDKYVETEIEEYKNKKIPIYNQYMDDIEVKIDNLKILSSPLRKGEKIGEIKLKVNNKTRVTANIISKKEVKKKKENDYIFEILCNFNRYFEKIIKQSKF